MAIRDIFKVSRKTFFNPRAWFAIDEYKTLNQVLWQFLRDLTTPRPRVDIIANTFEQMMARSGIAENDIQSRIIAYRRFALFFTALALFSFSYAFILLFACSSFFGWVLALCVCILFLAQAFKYDFWSLQLRSRKLTLTFNEWLGSLLGKSGGVK